MAKFSKPAIVMPLNGSVAAPEDQSLRVGLRHAVVFRDATAPFDLVPNVGGSLGGGALTLVEDATGPGFVGSAVTTSYAAVPFPEAATAKLTTVVLIRVVGALSVSRGIANTGYSNTDGWRLRYQSANTWRFRFTNGTNVNVDVTLTPAVGDLILLVGRLDGATAFGDVFNLTSGVRASNSSAFSSAIGSDSSELRVGSDSSTGGMENTLFHDVFEWGRYLNDRQVEQVVANPFSPVATEEDDLGFVAVAAVDPYPALYRTPSPLLRM